MNPTLITDLLTYALPSGFLAGTVTWLVSRRKRRNDMLADMQRSIDLLCEKYNDVLQENVTLRREKADWLVAQQELLRKIDKLTREVEGLRKNFNRKTQKKTDETSPTKKRPVLLPLLLLTAAGCATPAPRRRPRTYRPEYIRNEASKNRNATASYDNYGNSNRSPTRHHGPC